ncbi:TetR/AcrR family transcriptional regulator [Halodesulfovibrio sp. MK-HDV]|uniref:TetR/AcrR family transcriptional regulator n=1 Tax=Halodesulfovibrio sp. MK-HDV TaxID=2599925 RepID=UPI00136A5AC7|nr:TetR/AcrR family transcriptional regulator [Halodesulfovibrio sp. MK-HDV]KAF1074871.1 putative HTH-type transcriptional regulator YttP [Halodesulfovibrio sp. MK-HDV]
MGTSKNSEITCLKIIEAAGQLFAEKGFKAVTVREIVSAADTHLSALNYHFKNKEALYVGVLEDACRSVATTKEDQQALLKLPSTQALFAYVQGCVEGYVTQDGQEWRVALVSRNTVAPEAISNDIIQRYFHSELHFLSKIIARILEKPEDHPQTHFSALSLFGLMDAFGFYGVHTKGLSPTIVSNMQDSTWLAEHIVSLFVSGATSLKM